MVLSALLSGPRYVLSGLYNETETSSTWPAEGKAQANIKDKDKLKSQECDEKPYASGSSMRRDSAGSSLSTISDEDELSRDMDTTESTQAARGLSSKSNEPDKDKDVDKSSTTAGASEEITPRRSTRIKIAASQEGPRQRTTRRGLPKPLKSESGESLLILDSLKSPSSPTSTSRMTRYPRTPAPPRPLVPQRRPSYVASHGPLFNPLHKTLILDLDETLIHSMAKGGRMGTGQMVEVKLKNSVGANGVVIGPQVPILYWVLKRPYCDEFLRKVSTMLLRTGSSKLTPELGQQVVQSHHLHGIRTGICRSSYRYSRTRTQVLFRSILPPTLHISCRSLRQRPECGRT